MEAAPLVGPSLDVRSAPANHSTWATARRIVPAIAGILILLGIALRCYHVDHRVFWDDEVIATLHIVGVTEGEVVAHAASYRTMADLRAVVHPVATKRPLAATVDALRREDPQHGPLYYLIARVWCGIFGDSRVALRSLSALVGLIVLPCMFWLCMELFGSTLAAWTGVALMAISPVAVLYAQEVREYGLWLAAIVVSTALFVRAQACPSLGRWAAYAVGFALSLYVFPASVFVGAAHATTLLLGRQLPRSRWMGLAAIGLGFILFLPWLAVIVTHLDQIDRGMATIDHAHTSVATIVRTFASILRLDVLDVNAASRSLVAVLSIPIVGLVLYALYAAGSTTSALRPLVWMLAAWAVLPIVVPDLLLGGDRTANVRYFMPLFVAVDLALIDVLLGTVLAQRAPRVSQRMWAGVFALVVVAKLGSCVLGARASTWWSDYNNGSIAVAAILNRASAPLVLGDDYIVWSLSLSEYADPRIRVALDPQCYLCHAPQRANADLARRARVDSVKSVYLVAPSRRLQHDVDVVLAGRHPVPPSLCIDVRQTCTSGVSLWSM
jgi:uncharacterized membrane protein